MSLFNRKTQTKSTANGNNFLTELALATIHDGVIITNHSGVIQFINPAAVTMLDCGGAENALGLDYGLLLKLESKEGRELPEYENPLVQPMRTNHQLENYTAC